MSAAVRRAFDDAAPVDACAARALASSPGTTRAWLAVPRTDLGTEWLAAAKAHLRAQVAGPLDLVDTSTCPDAAAAIALCDALVYAPFPGGSVPAEVADQARLAESLGLPVWLMYRLGDNRISRTYPRQDHLEWDSLTAEATASRYATARP